ncbi:hypothetical protein GQE99_07255 [Maritimibacter sp. DP07]|jgi:hypothetical protein|uniref:Uncharacterized protein n=1 Tax=Maritimibacter harenae TaxID=2606218 RepID=A0A845LZQ0_9RHOB|nr:hypothetical protein [Maritimibacter harenae]MZR12816.1 hypothetical protein [Maritimibacter harenae]
MYETNPLPPTDKQLNYARVIARKLDTAIPRTSLESRQALSSWIDRHKPRHATHGVATSRQVAFAEKIARIKRRAIPDECFRDAGLMSRWIDANK